jgi:hypothetical protein
MSYHDHDASQNAYTQHQHTYSVPQSAYGQPDAYAQPSQQLYGQPGVPSPLQYGQPNYGQPVRGSNPWANSALFSGGMSIILALITLVSAYGFAGLITGSFAIYRGITALNVAKRQPGRPGLVRAILAIVLGALALLFVFVSFALRGFTGF